MRLVAVVLPCLRDLEIAHHLCQFFQRRSSEGSFDHAARGRPRLKLKAAKSGNQESRRSTRQKNPVKRYGYNEYMAHNYAYMTRVAEVHEPESYAEAAKDANWRAAMEEEMSRLNRQ